MAGSRIGKGKYVLIWSFEDHAETREYSSFREATNAYRRAKAVYGNIVMLAQVIIDYGEEV